MKYRFKTPAYSHQVKALKKLISNGDGGELFCDPRTGKTKIAIDYVSMLAQKRLIDKVIVVCPNRVMGTWIEQIHQHCPISVHTTIWDKDARSRTIRGRRVHTGPDPVRGAYDLHVVIVNYEAFSTPGRRTPSGRRSRTSGRFKNRDLLRKWMHSTDRHTCMILDESHRIASASGRASNTIVSMQGDAQYKLLMTGTPVTKATKVHDLYMQYKFRDPSKFADLPTLDEFKNYYGRWIHKNGYPQWVKAKNQDNLQQRLHTTAVVVRRDECFDLPPKQNILKSIPLTSSAQAYDDMAAEMVAKIIRAREEHTVEASIKLVQGLRLRQLTGGVAKTDEGRLIRIGSEKLIELRNDLEAANEHDEKVVIAAQFRADLTSIERVARREFKLPVFILKGGITRDEGDRAVREFRRHEGAGVFIVQPQSGSEGIDLSSSAHLIWFSLTPSFVKYTQMSDRIALSRTSTTFTYYLAKNTIDEVLFDTLQHDGEVARAILDSPEQLLRDPAQMARVEEYLREYS